MFGDRILVGGEEVLAGRKEKPDPGIFLKACELANQCEKNALCERGFRHRGKGGSACRAAHTRATPFRTTP